MTAIAAVTHPFPGMYAIVDPVTGETCLETFSAAAARAP
ncbi:hypothetical protein JAB1_09730 [Janthinobacterium sp. MP5059B]|nr:hypothetical protein JAB1_09730 [Janthinobacterium sp. MP5059B]